MQLGFVSHLSREDEARAWINPLSIFLTFFPNNILIEEIRILSGKMPSEIRLESLECHDNG
jgi:hypothetical protein